MNIEIVNPHTIKILIAAKPEDSISSIAARIGLSYGWTHYWISELAAIGVFVRTGKGLFLKEKHAFYRSTLEYIKSTFGKDVGFYYSTLKLFGIEYCFTKTDAVFVWTKGGYNIARSRDFYPIFIKLKKKDKELFNYYCKKLDLKTKPRKGPFFDVEIAEDFKPEYCDGVPVEKLDNTIDYMKKFIYNFEPALEMIKELYDKPITVQYAEIKTNA